MKDNQRTNSVMKPLNKKSACMDASGLRSRGEVPVPPLSSPCLTNSEVIGSLPKTGFLTGFPSLLLLSGCIIGDAENDITAPQTL